MEMLLLIVNIIFVIKKTLTKKLFTCPSLLEIRNILSQIDDLISEASTSTSTIDSVTTSSSSETTSSDNFDELETILDSEDYPEECVIS